MKILKRFKQPVETNYLTSDDSRKTTAAKYCIRIKGNPVMAILDSGAAVSIMTDKLRRKLRLEIDALSKTIIITADGTRARVLGQITSLKVFIQNMVVLVTLQIIESRKETLLLGTNWLDYMKANWNFRNRTLQIFYKGKTIVIGITYHANIPPQLPVHDNNDYEDENELLDEIEYEPESDLEE